MPSSTTNEKRTVVRGLGEIAFRVRLTFRPDHGSQVAAIPRN
jgi:hypothetical protein